MSELGPVCLPSDHYSLAEFRAGMERARRWAKRTTQHLSRTGHSRTHSNTGPCWCAACMRARRRETLIAEGVDPDEVDIICGVPGATEPKGVLDARDVIKRKGP